MPKCSVCAARIALIEPGPITHATIQEAVATLLGVPICDLCGQSRRKEICHARHLAMYLCRKHLHGMTLREIGEAFGGRDHTTVINAIRLIEDELDEHKDRTAGELIESIEGALLGIERG